MGAADTAVSESGGGKAVPSPPISPSRRSIGRQLREPEERREQEEGDSGDDDDEDGNEEEEEEDEEEDDDDDEPRLKYAFITKGMGSLYRNGDATSCFLVAGDKMVWHTR